MVEPISDPIMALRGKRELPASLRGFPGAPGRLDGWRENLDDVQ